MKKDNEFIETRIYNTKEGQWCYGLSKEAIDVIDSLDPKTIGPKDDYNLSMDQKAVQNKEKQLLKNLENIVNVLQMNVDRDGSSQKLSLEALKKRHGKN